MQSKNKNHDKHWKELSAGVRVSHFTSVHGKSHQIYVKMMESKLSIKPTVKIFLFHDISSYHGRFLGLIEWFLVQHPHVSFVMMDFLGHGLSSGSRGHIPDFKTLSQDAETLFKIIQRDFGKEENERWVALGHGMGGLVVLDLMNRGDEKVRSSIDQLILSNFVLNFNSKLLQVEGQLLSKFSFFRDTIAHIRPVEIYGAQDMLTHAKEQADYLEDPLLNRKPTYQSLKSLAEKVKSVYQDAYFLDKATLLLKSESHYMPFHGMEAFSKGLKKELLIEKRYSNLKHDLYNERENVMVFNDISEWVKK